MICMSVEFNSTPAQGRNVFPSFFNSLTSFYLITVGVGGYCCTWSHSVTHTHSVGLLWTRDQPMAETSTWQHTTVTRDSYPCPRLDSNPQSQEASGYRLTPSTTQPSESAKCLFLCANTLLSVSRLLSNTSHLHCCRQTLRLSFG
jgi:hypothetical protein